MDGGPYLERTVKEGLSENDTGAKTREKSKAGLRTQGLRRPSLSVKCRFGTS